MKTIPFLFLTLILCFLSPLQAQDSSTKGTDFWFAFMDNGEPTSPTTLKKLSIFISSEEANTGTVEIPGIAWVQNFSVAANSTVEVIVPTSIEFEDRQVIGDNGIHVTTDKKATVYALNYMSFSSDATIIYPTNTLGREYFNLTYRTLNIGTQYPSLMLLVGAHDNTVLEITPSVVTTAGNAANVPFTIILNQGETYMVANTSNGGDISGTYVKSVPNSDGECKEVAVFGGHFCANIPVGSTYCDHLYEQIPPTKQWGKSFITVPLKTRKKDVYKVMASKDNTTVTIGATPTTLNSGEIYEFILTDPTFIESDQPILLSQFSGGTGFDGVANSDPFMVLISPTEQTIEQVTFTAFSSTLILAFYLNVIVKTADVGSTFLDGVNVASEFSVVPDNPDFSYAQIDVSVGVHNLLNDKGVVSYIYGFGSRESYGYVAGANLKAINKGFDVVEGGIDSTFYSDFSNVIVCPGEKLEFVASSNDVEIQSYAWDLGGGLIVPGDTTSKIYPDTGTFTVTLIITYINGCEEELETTFEVRELETADQINVCEGDTIFGIPIFADTMLCSTFPSLYGCDSTHCYDIILELPVLTQVDTTICQGESVYGIPIFSDSLICNDYTSTLNGCDSTYCYNVSVQTLQIVQVDTVVCENAVVNGVPITNDTLMCGTYSTLNGCDSIFCINVILELPSYEEKDTIVCENTLFNGIPILADTLLCDTFLNVNNCDSIFCFNVMLTTPVYVEVDTMVCKNSIIYNTLAIADTTICNTFVNSFGCDSTHCYKVSIIPTINTQTDTMVCENSVIYNNFIVSDTIVCNTFITANGCDSIHCYNASLIPPVNVQTDTMVCPNAIIYGTAVTSNTVLCNTFLTANGCDSIHCYNVSLIPPINVQTDTMVCPNAIIYGTAVTSSTVLCNTFLTANGCDSTHCFDITLIPPVATQKDTLVCQDVFVYGALILADTIICRDFTTLNGCDSTHCYTITAEPPVFTDSDTILCEGDVWEGQFIFSDTTLCKLYTNVNGCDSTHCQNITLKYQVSVDKDTMVCVGEIVYGVSVFTDDYICNVFTAANGCDSTHCYDVSVKQGVTIQEDTLLCQGGELGGLVLYADTFLCNTYFAANGCDSIHCFEVEIAAPTFNEINSTICEGELYPFGSSVYTESGQYTNDIVPLGDCQPIDQLNLKVLPTINDSFSLTICEGEEYLGHTISGTYIDTLRTAENCIVNRLELEVEEEMPMQIIEDYTCPCNNKVATYGFEKSGLYIIDTLINENGCEVIQAVNFTNYSVYIPNAFSPNGDGVNDEFRIYREVELSGEAVVIEYLGIFDRWGGIILEQRQGMVMNKPLWDGTVVGEELNSGVYVYVVELSCPATGSTFKCQGDIMIVK